MYPKEDKDIDDIDLGKTLILTFVIISIGMTEKVIYKIQKFFKK